MNEVCVEVAVFEPFEPGQIDWLGLGRRSAFKYQFVLAKTYNLNLHSTFQAFIETVHPPLIAKVIFLSPQAS